ncbi:rhodanese-like domain-containing protein [Rheinheimera maricola]|uniref:Rhodanese-like domain-containing protein n=1 Tax=Rheinheimera maricola TaxID=2793282 RepID=A0ABS7X7H4_9GAMM|nr:rhodanese-like domain-containing protein [Rheinheimera maricola]MBZ9610678.1 rhodanese-like domain-containing protein [Rheinheimera maricola]
MRIIFVLLTLLLLSSCASKPIQTTQTVWLDVRSAEEFAAGHLPGAINIPHTEVVKGLETLKLDKNRDIALYCGSGRRAGIAIEALQQQGYTNLTNQGGYESLKQKQLSADERQ